MLYDDMRQEVSDRFYYYFDEDVAANLGELCWDDEFVSRAASRFVDEVETNGGNNSYKSMGLYSPLDLIRDIGRAVKLRNSNPDIEQDVAYVMEVLSDCGLVFDTGDRNSVALFDIAIVAFAWLGANLVFDGGIGALLWEDGGCWFEYSL